MKLAGFVRRGVCSSFTASTGIFRQWRFQHCQVSITHIYNSVMLTHLF